MKDAGDNIKAAAGRCGKYGSGWGRADLRLRG